MDLSQYISNLKASAERQLHALDTEEKTKNAILLPFFRVLGYDPIDLRDVEPQFPVELDGMGPREVDYAVKVDGSPVMLFQWEKAEVDLDTSEGDPLYRKLPILDTSVVVHTNGLSYRLYVHLGAQSRIEDRPFLEFDLLDHTAEEIEQLQLLTKSTFDTEALLAAAFEHRYGQRLEQFLARQKETPSDHFVRFLAAQAFEGDVSAEDLERFRPVVRDVLHQHVSVNAETAPEQTSEPAPELAHPADKSESNDVVPDVLRNLGSAPEESGDGSRNTTNSSSVQRDGRPSTDGHLDSSVKPRRARSPQPTIRGPSSVRQTVVMEGRQLRPKMEQITTIVKTISLRSSPRRFSDSPKRSMLSGKTGVVANM